ncbi:MAG: bifunctional metallophosphatase/5'-nucleotidase [Bacilli bacterium]|nr:bifunctional metallophosphatase/5'-nucleotidase [Bacilli bacterium]
MKRNRLTLFFGLLLPLSLVGCHTPEAKDIHILYTTDVHCGLTDHLGYSGIVSYKEELAKTGYVSLVDAGDFLQGDYVGAVSNGKYLIDVMNEAGYEVAALGNHEFDYGMDELKQRIAEFKGDIVSANVRYIGSHENKLSAVKPYVIKTYGTKKVGYVGITTPHTIVESSPKNFMEDGKQAYDFSAETASQFYELIQTNIDACKRDGADYVILLSHLGSPASYTPYSSKEVIANTSGAIAALDGHAHVDLPWTTVKNGKGEDTLLVDTGYKLNDFATLTLGKDGNISFKFVNDYTGKSEKMDAFLAEINQKVEEEGNKVVAHIDVDLDASGEKGHRPVRMKETPIGNMIADAYRSMAESDIGVVNGGGIRESLAKGDVTYRQIKNVHPFGNLLKKKKTTGAHILDHLELGVKNLTRNEQGELTGEFGGFVHVSGLKYSINTAIPSGVVLNEQEQFVRVDGPRRVYDVKVLQNGAYVDLDPNATYTIASHDFLLDNGGDGAAMYMQDESIPWDTPFDYEVVIDYIVDVCQGKLKDKYSAPEGRITMI